MVSLKRSVEPEAESRPSKQVRASRAERDVPDDAAAIIDKDPTMPRRDPSADLQRPSTTDLPTRLHAGLDGSEPPRLEGQYHPGVVPNSDETSSAAAIPQPPRVALLDEGDNHKNCGFNEGYEAASAASQDVPALHEGDGHEEPDRQDDPEEDEFELTEGHETDLTSATSFVFADHTHEKGRRYQNFKNGPYPIPNDTKELDREDMKHAMMNELLDGRLFLAPIGEQPRKILDIGTGSGIWAIEVGDRFPGAHVRGTDQSPEQCKWTPPNVDFILEDCEQDEWLAQDYDFIHFRFMASVLKDVAGVLRQTYKSLKPGGWVEFQELSAEVLCDDGTMPDNDPVKHMYELIQRAFTEFGMNVTVPKDLENLLRDAGFENIQCVVEKVPIGPWACDKRLRFIGTFQKMAVQNFMPVLPGRLFPALGMSEIESQVTLAHARLALDNTRAHRYFHYFFWFARKPK